MICCGPILTQKKLKVIILFSSLGGDDKIKAYTILCNDKIAEFFTLFAKRRIHVTASHVSGVAVQSCTSKSFLFLRCHVKHGMRFFGQVRNDSKSFPFSIDKPLKFTPRIYPSNLSPFTPYPLRLWISPSTFWAWIF